MTASLRLMQATDLAGVAALQDQCYGNLLYEPPALLAVRWQSAASSCWVACSDTGQLLAYLFCYPSQDGKVTPLAQPFSPANEPELLYMHDMAVSPLARGQGLAARLLAQAEQFALYRQLPKLALVAVQGSVPYWQKQGFVLQAVTEEAQHALQSYTGENARYMQKALPRVNVGLC